MSSARIDKDGYLRVQRLPTTGLRPHYNELQEMRSRWLLVRAMGGPFLP